VFALKLTSIEQGGKPMVETRNVRRMAEDIVAREGGYVNDPDDPGGATKYGVTIHTMRRLGMDLSGDGVVDAEDVRRITRAQAVEIYLDHYFLRPRIAELPEALHATVFDMYVNAGANAVKILQRLLNQMGETVSVDGALGPQTIAACARAYAKAPSHMADAYGIARRNYYFRIADQRPASRKYARTRAGGKGGWIKRSEEFISARYHMTDAEFQARVAAWG
jgi:lysozyme family protein